MWALVGNEVGGRKETKEKIQEPREGKTEIERQTG